MFRHFFYISIILPLIFALETGGLRSELRRNHQDFVVVKNGQFELNGSPYVFYGTNAYWLHMLSDEDMLVTLHDIAGFGHQVVRTWAFNDVTATPNSGAFFQVINNNQTTINFGPQGLQRLDKVVSTAKSFGLRLVLSLTNNWSPTRPEPSTAFKRDNSDLPRGYLSNDYGGMDTYNNQFTKAGGTVNHDNFYTDPGIISAFKKYVSAVVSRYANDSTILAWELGNDIRCSSTVPASPNCNSATITNWVLDISNFIKQHDSNHLVTAGDGGFYCRGCHKRFAPPNITPPGQGPAFDGSFGVDTEDIVASPCIDFGSFQLFPDQVQYSIKNASDASVTAIQHGGEWVGAHSQTSIKLGKPEALLAFGLVTKDNSPFFVPFNGFALPPANAPCGGVDEFQADYAYISWAMAALFGNIRGALEFQWLQDGLQSIPKTTANSKRDLNTSPGTYGRYPNPNTKQSNQQYLDQPVGF